MTRYTPAKPAARPHNVDLESQVARCSPQSGHRSTPGGTGVAHSRHGTVETGSSTESIGRKVAGWDTSTVAWALNPRLSGLHCSACGRRHDHHRLQGVCGACGRPLLAGYRLDSEAPPASSEALPPRGPGVTEVTPAARDLSSCAGVDAAPEAGAAWAAVRHLRKEGWLVPGEQVVVLNTGRSYLRRGRRSGGR